MNLKEQILKIRKVMGLMLEYVETPVITRDEEEEDGYRDNTIMNLFAGDSLEIRNYLQKIFPSSNLKYLGAGANGLAYEPKGGLSYSPGFTDNNFLGQLPPKDASIVLKLTLNGNEAKKIKNFIEKSGGMAPGLASYYFVKEIDLDSEKQFSTTLGPPTLRGGGKTKEMRIDDFKKRYDRKWYPKLSDKEYEEMVDKLYQNFIKLKMKRGDVKYKKMYLICLDKVEQLSPEYKHILEICFSYWWFIQHEHKKGNRNNDVRQFKPIGVIKSVYLNDRTMKDWYDKGPGKEKDSLSYDVFRQTFIKLIDTIEKVYSGGERPKDYDLQPGNMGLKNGEFVFFDMFA